MADMKRRALLIEASDVPNDKLPGPKADAKGFHDWLYSKAGGDWFESEIHTLHTPTKAQVWAKLLELGKVDYGFVLFAGHGYHSQDLDQTKVLLKDGYLSVRELIPDTQKCTVIVDACRNVMPEFLVESIDLSLNESVKYARARIARNFRADFERQVEVAEKGIEFLYSCDLNESAGDTRRGGYFSQKLLEAGAAFAAGNREGRNWYPVASAFRDAKVGTIAVSNNTQHPVFEPGRRLVHFPFGV